MTYRDNIWRAMSYEHDKIHVKTRKSRQIQLLKMYSYWSRTE